MSARRGGTGRNGPRGRDADLLRAVSEAGSYSELARLCGLSRQAVCQWRSIPPAHRPRLEALVREGGRRPVRVGGRRDPGLERAIHVAGGARALARLAGVSATAAQRWRAIPHWHLARLSSALGLPVREIRTDLTRFQEARYAPNGAYAPKGAFAPDGAFAPNGARAAEARRGRK